VSCTAARTPTRTVLLLSGGLAIAAARAHAHASFRWTHTQIKNPDGCAPDAHARTGVYVCQRRCASAHALACARAPLALVARAPLGPPAQAAALLALAQAVQRPPPPKLPQAPPLPRRRSCRRRRRCHAAATASPAATATADIVNELSLEPACVPMLLPPLESPLEPSPPPRQLPPPLALLPETTCAARRVLTRARTWTAAACTRRGLTPEVARAASFRAARGVVRRREAVRGGVSL
jgi:hypothetical protein